MKKFGFTLIELLIVIAIIGILVAVGTASYLTAAKQSRDTRRKTDLEQIRAALETFRSENGTYPPSTSSLVPDYVSVLPTGPLAGELYTYSPATSTTYSLCTDLENVTPASYCVQEP